MFTCFCVELVSCTFMWLFCFLYGRDISLMAVTCQKAKNMKRYIASSFTIFFCYMFEMENLFHPKPNAPTKFSKFDVTNVCFCKDKSIPMINASQNLSVTLK